MLALIPFVTLKQKLKTKKYLTFCEAARQGIVGHQGFKICYYKTDFVSKKYVGSVV